MPVTDLRTASARPRAHGGEPFDRDGGRRHLGAGRRPAGARLALDLDSHRAELRHHCSRILGSTFEADDAVQETLVRAWRAVDRFDGRSSLRTWLYAIATNVCLSMRQAPQRRARPSGLSADAPAGASADRCPDETVAERDAVRLAFVVALNRLPPRQRTVIVLRDVLAWRAGEVAELLGTTVVSVNSALQRARTTLGVGLVGGADRARGDRRPDPRARVHHERLARCIAALERCDASALASLLGDDGEEDRSSVPLELDVEG